MTIMVDDVNEAPAFATAAVTTLWVTENDDNNTLRTTEDGTGPVAAYAATDVDTNNDNDETPGIEAGDNAYGRVVLTPSRSLLPHLRES